MKVSFAVARKFRLQDTVLDISVQCETAFVLRCEQRRLISACAFAQSDQRHVDSLLHVYSKICITKTCLYNFDLLKPHFYTVRLLFFLFLPIYIHVDCGR